MCSWCRLHSGVVWEWEYSLILHLQKKSWLGFAKFTPLCWRCSTLMFHTWSVGGLNCNKYHIFYNMSGFYHLKHAVIYSISLFQSDSYSAVNVKQAKHWCQRRKMRQHRFICKAHFPHEKNVSRLVVHNEGHYNV